MQLNKHDCAKLEVDKLNRIKIRNSFFNNNTIIKISIVVKET